MRYCGVTLVAACLIPPRNVVTLTSQFLHLISSVVVLRILCKSIFCCLGGEFTDWSKKTCLTHVGLWSYNNTMAVMALSQRIRILEAIDCNLISMIELYWFLVVLSFLVGLVLRLCVLRSAGLARPSCAGFGVGVGKDSVCQNRVNISLVFIPACILNSDILWFWLVSWTTCVVELRFVSWWWLNPFD